MLGIFKKQTGTKVRVLVEYELDYDEKIDKDNISDIVDFNDIVKDSSNIVAVRNVKFETIRR
jgi:dihydroneopterin aldolase